MEKPFTRIRRTRRMRRSATALLLLLMVGQGAGFSSPAATTTTFRVPRHCRVGSTTTTLSSSRVSSLTDEAPNSSNSTRRRRFLATAIGSAAAAAVGVTAIQPSCALAESGNSGTPAGGGKKKSRYTGLAAKIRKVGFVMDELQRDLMQERWDLVETYPAQLRSFVPLFTTFTDSAFPSDEPTDKGLRVALRYEVGRFFASLERFRQATARKSLNEAYVAYSDMSLHFDRYLHVGGLYTYYDDVISLEPYFKGTPEDALVYADPKKDPAEVRDLVVLTKGPDKGKTGIVIGIYPDGSKTCAVKLDRVQGMREIKVVPQQWAAKRLGEQDPDEAFLIARK